MLTCSIHSLSSRALRNDSSVSEDMELGAHALRSFLKELFTCLVSANSTGTSSQFRAESSFKPCHEKTFEFLTLFLEKL